MSKFKSAQCSKRPNSILSKSSNLNFFKLKNPIFSPYNLHYSKKVTVFLTASMKWQFANLTAAILAVLNLMTLFNFVSCFKLLRLLFVNVILIKMEVFKFVRILEIINFISKYQLFIF